MTLRERALMLCWVPPYILIVAGWAVVVGAHAAREAVTP